MVKKIITNLRSDLRSDPRKGMNAIWSSWVVFENGQRSGSEELNDEKQIILGS
jgi:hypothetical protein